jgi:hypothetical protein
MSHLQPIYEVEIMATCIVSRIVRVMAPDALQAEVLGIDEAKDFTQGWKVIGVYGEPIAVETMKEREHWMRA